MASTNYAFMKSDKVRYDHDQHKYKDIETGTHSDAARYPRKKISINFDKKGRMWYTYIDEDGIYIAKRAIFHHWIRRELSEMENSRTQYGYHFPRKEGIGATNKTCFNRYQRRYGTQRDNYAPIMFTYEASGHQIRVFNAGDLYWHKRLVIDYWLGRVSNRRELPLVLSDQFEGEFMEPALRIHPHINYRTIRARMPPFIKTRKEGKYREIWNPNALSNRTERFRDRMGAISWARGGVDPKKKQFLDSRVSQEARVGNDTKGCRDLTKAEMEDLNAYLKNK